MTAASRAHLVWNTKELRGKAGVGGQKTIELGYSFLDDLIDDPMDVFDGTLDIDLEIADAKRRWPEGYIITPPIHCRTYQQNERISH